MEVKEPIRIEDVEVNKNYFIGSSVVRFVERNGEGGLFLAPGGNSKRRGFTIYMVETIGVKKGEIVDLQRTIDPKRSIEGMKGYQEYYDKFIKSGGEMI